MRLCSRVVGGLLLAVLTFSVLGASTRETSKVHDSPEAVFTAVKSAMKKGDYKGVLACMSDDCQKLVTGQLITTGMMIKHFAPQDPSGKAAEMVKPVDEVFSKHGLTEQALKKIKPAKDSKELAKSLRSASELVKSRVTFFVDFNVMLAKADPRAPKPFINAALIDVKIEGDKARGTLVEKLQETESRYPISFVKLGGGWKIVLPEPKMNPSRLPPPAKEVEEL
jgi:hypothetical protein